MDIYYGVNERLERENKLLKESSIPSEVQDLFRQYQDHLKARGTGQSRISKVNSHLRRLWAGYQPACPAEFSKLDAQQLVARIQDHKTWGAHSKRDYVRAFKQFIYWYEEEDERLFSEDSTVRFRAQKMYEYVRKHVKTPKPKNQLRRSDLLSDEESRRLIIDGCYTAMERAFISFLHEVPVRIGEVLQMKICDVDFQNKHAKVTVPMGKTTTRTVPVIKSVPYLQEWLRDHPSRKDSTAPLWVSKHNRFSGRAIKYAGARGIILRVKERAGIKKRVFSHLFRHSRATLASRDTSAQILCKAGGWVQGSRQLATYTHLDDKDVEDVFLEKNGLGEDVDKPPEFRFCEVCGTTNAPESRYCQKCGNALLVQTILEDEEQKSLAINEAMVLFGRIMADPKQREAFEAFVESEKKN